MVCVARAVQALGEVGVLGFALCRRGRGVGAVVEARLEGEQSLSLLRLVDAQVADGLFERGLRVLQRCNCSHCCLQRATILSLSVLDAVESVAEVALHAVDRREHSSHGKLQSSNRRMWGRGRRGG